MNNYYFMNAARIILSLVLLNILSACGDSNNTASKTNQATTEMPAGLQKLSGTGAGTLEAFVTIDGDMINRIKMDIDGTGEGSASASIPGLSLAPHTVLITYEYTDGDGTIILATTPVTDVDLTSGSASISFTASDYNLDAHDADGDGISNADELAAGSDPRDSECVIGISTIGNCTLG